MPIYRCFAAVVLFNPFGHKHHDLIEVALNIPEGIAAYELISADKTVIPHEFIDSNNDELANVLLRKSELRGTIGAITDGHVAGAAIVKVKVSRQGSTVSIDAILDNKGQPSIPNGGRQRRISLRRIRSRRDPLPPTRPHPAGVEDPIRYTGYSRPGMADAVGARHPGTNISPRRNRQPAAQAFLPLVLRFAQSDLGANLLAALDRGDEKKPPFVIENEYFRVEAAHDGTLTVIDKRTNTIFSGLNQFVDGGDAGDEYNYSPPQNDPLSHPQTCRR